jgi:hypothetical protein
MNGTDSYEAAVASVVENLAFLMPVGPGESPASWAVRVVVPWTGPDGSRGRVLLALDRGAAEATAANLLGLMPGEPPADADIDDGTRELANVIAGNLLPTMYGEDHEFHFEIPESFVEDTFDGRTIAIIAFVEGTLGVWVQSDADNTRILRAISADRRAGS